jgi:hypothetical protein
MRSGGSGGIDAGLSRLARATRVIGGDAPRQARPLAGPPAARHAAAQTTRRI